MTTKDAAAAAAACHLRCERPELLHVARDIPGNFEQQRQRAAASRTLGAAGGGGGERQLQAEEDGGRRG